MNVTQTDIEWVLQQIQSEYYQNRRKCKYILAEGVSLKAMQEKAGDRIKYPSRFWFRFYQVALQVSSRKFRASGMSLGILLCWAAGHSDKEDLAKVRAATAELEPRVPTEFGGGAGAAVSSRWWLALMMGNDRKVENSGSQGGYNWQALPLARVQESTRGI